MLKQLLWIALVWACASPAYGMERFWSYCQRGGVKVVTQGLTSDNPFQRSYTSCTVSVYHAGTATLVKPPNGQLYSDNQTPTPTPMSNSFTANTDGYFEFYTVAGRYDVTITDPATSTSWTWGDVQICDSLGPNSDAACQAGGPSSPHNLLSTTHPDTVPYSPPQTGDLIRGNSNQLWERFAGGTDYQLLTIVSNLETWRNFNFYQNSTTPVNAVGRLGLNLIGGTGVTITPTDDAGNNRVNYTFAVAAPTTGKCPTGPQQFMTGINGTVDCAVPPGTGGVPSPPQFSVQFNDPLGVFAGSSKFVTNSTGFVDINGGGTFEIDALVSPSGNNIFTDGMNLYAYNNGADVLGSFEFYYDDSAKPPTASVFTVSNVAITSKILTVTTTTNPGAVKGSPVVFAGLTTAAFLNNLILYAADTTASTVVCYYNHVDYGSTADTGTVSKQTPADIIDLYPNVDIFKPQGKGRAIDAVLESDVTTPFVSDNLTGFKVERGGSGSTAHVYGADIEDFSLWADTVESAQIRTQYSGGTPTPHDYAIKVERDAHGSPGVYAYPTGDLYARNSFEQVTGTTVAACVQTVGAGLWDCTAGIVDAGGGPGQSETVTVEICTAGVIDTFDWGTNGAPTCATPTPLNNHLGSYNLIGDSLKITWGATTGHTAGNQGTFKVTVGTLDVGAAAATRSPAITVLAPVIANSGLILIANTEKPIKITRLFCAIQGSTNVVLNLDKRTEAAIGTDSGNHLLAADLTAISTGANTSTFANGSGQCGDTTSCYIPAHTPVVMTFTSVADTPEVLDCSYDATVMP